MTEVRDLLPVLVRVVPIRAGLVASSLDVHRLLLDEALSAAAPDGNAAALATALAGFCIDEKLRNNVAAMIAAAQDAPSDWFIVEPGRLVPEGC